MQVPHTRLTVTAVSFLPTPSGVAYNADLHLDGQSVGWIHNEGRGGMTAFHSNGTRFGWRDLDQYTAACRWNGQPTDEETVLEALIDEHIVDQAIRKSLAARVISVRLVSEDGRTCTADLSIQTDRLDTDASRSAAVEAITAIAASQFPYVRTLRWEHWTGTEWHHLGTVPAPIPAA